MMVDNEQFWPDKLPRGTATRRQLFSGSSQVAGTAHGSPQNVNRLTAGTLKGAGGCPASGVHQMQINSGDGKIVD
jgi:hypothetical protein